MEINSMFKEQSENIMKIYIIIWIQQKKIYMYYESNQDLQTNDPIHERKKKLFSGPSGQ